MSSRHDQGSKRTPEAIQAIQDDTAALGFTMASEPMTGALLGVLAASKPGGRVLELGTATGLGTAWLLAGMDAGSRLGTVDIDEKLVAVARRHLGSDARATFDVMEGADFIGRSPERQFDPLRKGGGLVDAPGRARRGQAQFTLLKRP